MQKILSFLAAAVITFGLSNTSSGYDAKKPMDRKAMIEMCEQMAKAHQKMAECLKTDRTDKDCADEMKESCPMMKDGKTCPMMEMMEGGHTKMHEHKK